MQYYGYSRFVSEFFVSESVDNDSDKLDLANSIPIFNTFIQSMPNLKQIIVMNMPSDWRRLNRSISLSDGLYSELIESIDLISSMSYSLFEYIQIVYPLDKLDSFINKYGQKFQSKGWKLSRATFKYVPFGLELKDDNYDNSLLIQRI